MICLWKNIKSLQILAIFFSSLISKAISLSHYCTLARYHESWCTIFLYTVYFQVFFSSAQRTARRRERDYLWILWDSLLSSLLSASPFSSPSSRKTNDHTALYFLYSVINNFFTSTCNEHYDDNKADLDPFLGSWWRLDRMSSFRLEMTLWIRKIAIYEISSNNCFF